MVLSRIFLYDRKYIFLQWRFLNFTTFHNFVHFSMNIFIFFQTLYKSLSANGAQVSPWNLCENWGFILLNYKVLYSWSDVVAFRSLTVICLFSGSSVVSEKMQWEISFQNTVTRILKWKFMSSGWAHARLGFFMAITNLQEDSCNSLSICILWITILSFLTSIC
jgi:hypothetical protein